mmetsp:Transcript_6574/g.27632  ORF Transcript_6574/g.27632 Transcript_6574/m.27632 type:complete len:279 (-) Transcript_6574:1297-2133(-)
MACPEEQQPPCRRHCCCRPRSTRDEPASEGRSHPDKKRRRPRQVLSDDDVGGGGGAPTEGSRRSASHDRSTASHRARAHDLRLRPEPEVPHHHGLRLAVHGDVDGVRRRRHLPHPPRRPHRVERGHHPPHRQHVALRGHLHRAHAVPKDGWPARARLDAPRRAARPAAHYDVLGLGLRAAARRPARRRRADDRARRRVAHADLHHPRRRRPRLHGAARRERQRQGRGRLRSHHVRLEHARRPLLDSNGSKRIIVARGRPLCAESPTPTLETAVTRCHC